MPSKILKIYKALERTLQDKEMWKEWLIGLGIYLGPWNGIEVIGGKDLRRELHEIEEWVNFGYTVPFLFPLSSPLRKFIKNLTQKELDFKTNYLLEISSVALWKFLQYLGRSGGIPLIPAWLWESEQTDYPSLFNYLENFLRIELTESLRDFIRSLSLGSLIAYWKRKTKRIII